MAIYVARSPYRSSFRSKPKLKISFPKITGLFGKKAARQRRVLPSLTTHNRQNFSNVLQKVKTATLRYEFGPGTVMAGLMFAAILLSLIYLMRFNKVATKGYDLNRLDASRQQLLEQYDINNMKLAQIRSLHNIIESGRLEHMRHPGNITFVRGGNSALASLN